MWQTMDSRTWTLRQFPNMIIINLRNVNLKFFFFFFFFYLSKKKLRQNSQKNLIFQNWVSNFDPNNININQKLIQKLILQTGIDWSLIETLKRKVVSNMNWEWKRKKNLSDGFAMSVMKETRRMSLFVV